jgi:cytochrome c-type biogenesis protein CcmH/NrfG
VNLALTLEQAGRIGEAMDAYRAALELVPEDIGAIQGIASLASARASPNLRSTC